MKKIFILLICFALVSCHSVPAIDTTKTDLLAIDVMETQTEIVSTGKDVEATISDIKEITDEAKTTGEIPKEKVTTLIKYVDLSAEQIKKHNEKTEKLTKKISELERSRIIDNSQNAKAIADKETQYQRDKVKASIFLKWALIATVCALVLAGFLFWPKIKTILKCVV